jgi:uncharacterized lipoprotein YbaY
MAKLAPLVRCVVVLDKDARSFSSATLFVRVDDVTLADTTSTPLAHTSITGVSHRRGSATSWTVELDGDTPHPQHRYSIWAHLDIDGDEQVSHGDYITMESYPVLTLGYPAETTVHLHLVG